MFSVVIATHNRAGELVRCLESLNKQILSPNEIIIAHTGFHDGTRELIQALSNDPSFRIKIEYLDCGERGASRQRNLGAQICLGDFIVFVDDDVICEEYFTKELIDVFLKDQDDRIAGVSGTIINQSYVELSQLNKFFLDFSLSPRERSCSYAGRLVGPAVNFLPLDKPNTIQEVEWLPSGCCAYRRNIFNDYKFNELFKGYSFMEDVELSARLNKKYLLLNTTKARCLHKDLGGFTQLDMVSFGRAQVVNRWYIVSNVLEKKGFVSCLRFAYYQLYCFASELFNIRDIHKLPSVLTRSLGRLIGIFSITGDFLS